MEMRVQREPWVKIVREQLPEENLRLLTRYLPHPQAALPPGWDTADRQRLFEMAWNLHKDGPSDGLAYEEWIAPQW